MKTSHSSRSKTAISIQVNDGSFAAAATSRSAAAAFVLDACAAAAAFILKALTNQPECAGWKVIGRSSYSCVMIYSEASIRVTEREKNT